MRREVALVAALLVGACGSSSSSTSQVTQAPVTEAPVTEAPVTEATATSLPVAAEGCADVVGVDVEEDGSGFTFAVTVRSADTGWEKYADAWVVLAPSGETLGERVLAHPHVDEQPFTRSQRGIVIPEGLSEVEVAARDSVAGFCGATMVVAVPGRS